MELLERKLSVLRQQKQLLQQEITDNKQLGVQVGMLSELISFYGFSFIFVFFQLYLVLFCLQVLGHRTLPTSSPSARQTHSDDLCAQRRLDVRALNWDDVRSQSVVRTFGTVCHHLYPP